MSAKRFEAAVTFLIEAETQEAAAQILSECIFVDLSNADAVDHFVSGEPSEIEE